MRTTLTVEPDVERLLQAAMAASGQSFKETVNQALRRGLAGVAVGNEEPPFKVLAAPMKLCAGIDPTRLQESASDQEVDAFLELSRRLEASASDRR